MHHFDGNVAGIFRASHGRRQIFEADGDATPPLFVDAMPPHFVVHQLVDLVMQRIEVVQPRAQMNGRHVVGIVDIRHAARLDRVVDFLAEWLEIVRENVVLVVGRRLAELRAVAVEHLGVDQQVL